MRYISQGIILLFGMIISNPTNIHAQLWTLQKIHSIVNDVNTDELRPIVCSDDSGLFFTRQGSPYFNKSFFEDGVDLSLVLSLEELDLKLIELYSELSGKHVGIPHKSPFNQDIWFLENGNEKFATVHHLESPLNNVFPNSMCALSSDGSEAILINQFPVEGGIKKGFSLIKRDLAGAWSTPQPLTILGLGQIEPDVNLALSEDAQHLILSFQRADSYNHSNDLYISERIDEYTWGKPLHLGPAINSAYHETAPFLTAGGSKLFFASNRRGSYGGSDIFYVERIGDSWKKWSAPRALPKPINSASHESHPYFVEKTGELYFSSRRDGSSDIFKIQIAPPSSNMVELAGNVREAGGNRPVNAVIIAQPAGSMFLRELIETKNGRFSMKIPKGKLYDIQAQKDGYLTASKSVKFDPRHVFFNAIPINFEMLSDEGGESYVLENIHFKQSTPELLTSSLGSINTLAQTMKDNPFLGILIVGHTDNQGPKNLLYRLSDERALAVKNFLVNQYFISPSRIQTKGLGDSRPLNANLDEGQRSQNRRVEIKIVNDNPEYSVGTR